MLPTIAARRQALTALVEFPDLMGTCGLSYVGKANFGAAERYVREMSDDRLHFGTFILVLFVK